MVWGLIEHHLKDSVDFAVIGSQDKDTKEDRFVELMDAVRDLNYRVGWKHIQGVYTYKDNETDVEDSLIIYNIKKEDALRIAREINQETIVWKDNNFFGLLTPNGDVDMEFGQGISLDKKKASEYGSRLLGRHNNAKAFVFEHKKYPQGSGFKNARIEPTIEKIFSFERK